MRPVLFALALLAASPAAAETIRVIDGDTVRVDDTAVRLIGLNAPESNDQALCAYERRLGVIAKARLKDLVQRGTAAVRLVPCSCKPGTEGTKRCNFGRSCGVLTIDGRDAADILIGEGLAVPFHCGPTSCPKMPKPWCPKKKGDRP